MSAGTPPGDTYSNTFRAIGITFANILTHDAAMRACLDRAQMAASGDVTVLILGETGTGKNLVAQAIHNASRRAAGPYVSTNCSALPENLLESELFGHEKGAFTSADKMRRGCFERANSGTLFLDEIGDMSLTAQAKVLHAIEYKQFARVGGEAVMKTDVRIVAATNQPLRDQILTNTFRADLFYRLAEVTVEIPPLRARKDDIPLYVDAFIEEANEKYGTKIKKVSRGALAKLKAHDWPGNVRELRAQIRSAVMLCRGKILDVGDFNFDIRHVESVPPSAPMPPKTPAAPPRPPSNPSLPSSASASVNVARPASANAVPAVSPPDSALAPASAPAMPVWPAMDGPLDLASVEKAHILRVLHSTGWIKKEAAQLLGISRPTLDRKIEQYGISKDA